MRARSMHTCAHIHADIYVYVAWHIRAVAYVRSPTSIMSARLRHIGDGLRHTGGGSFDLDNESADVDVTTLEPRVIIRRGARWREKFCSYWTDNLPDLSDRPEIPAEKVQFWMKDEDKRGGRKRSTRRKRYPAAHSRLRGLRGQTLNEGIDYAIAANKWCVSFKDDDGTLVNLVDNCIVCVWLKYISKMVSLQCCVYDTSSTKSCLRNVVFVNHSLSTSCRIRFVNHFYVFVQTISRLRCLHVPTHSVVVRCPKAMLVSWYSNIC